ncbi:Mis12-Mtw1 protein family-domain-containing protein [Favolaschia claudopus]|uniref:Mis12-Mtw1 protein family-domain-containing protein n=1 Tax=Favolaschia claudopus TaxID=2862362 RepID=A0AAW0EHZ7_9AGAR
MATRRDSTNPAANPLLAASSNTRTTAAPKKSNKSLASTAKRKYTEETPGGLLIVREPRNDAQRQPTAGPSNPPAKKFKADALSVPQQPTRNASVDPVVENDVRQMEDEANNLRRASRANSSNLASPSSMSFRPSSPVKPPPKPSKSKSKKAATRVVTDTEVPLLDGTPQAERNKMLRSDAMAAIARDRERGNSKTPEPDKKSSHQRRNSFGGRGKRISTSFQAGAFTLPHPKVNEESFYKHIDRDLPDPEQLRQLLTWSSSRASSSSSSGSASLPPEDVSAFKSMEDDMVRSLAERRINLSLYGPDDENAPTGTNAQNEKNKQWEVIYTQQLREAQEEDEEWKKTGYFYDAYTSKERRRIDERRHAHRNAPPDERLLDNERLRYGLRLSNAPPDADGLEAQIRARVPDLQFKLDMLHTNLHAARTCARVASRALDARFGLLDAGLGGLAARNRSRVNGFAGPSGSGSGIGGSGRREGDTAQGLLRALASVDMERPPGKVGDAARKAAREAQRAVKSGDGERRLTLPTAGGPGTPKRPGTPRRERERTPGREQQRERTPGRS